MDKVIEQLCGRWFGVLLGLLFWGCLTANAAGIYQWRDESGVMHFSDSPMHVPSDKRPKAFREVHPDRGMQIGGNQEASGGYSSIGRGKQLWESKCSSCHIIDRRGLQGDKLGLQQILVNRDTKYPRTSDELRPIFDRAVRGLTSDMPPVVLAAGELDAILAYLVDASSPVEGGGSVKVPGGLPPGIKDMRSR